MCSLSGCLLRYILHFLYAARFAQPIRPSAGQSSRRLMLPETWPVRCVRISPVVKTQTFGLRSRCSGPKERRPHRLWQSGRAPALIHKANGGTAGGGRYRVEDSCPRLETQSVLYAELFCRQNCSSRSILFPRLLVPPISSRPKSVVTLLNPMLPSIDETL